MQDAKVHACIACTAYEAACLHSTHTEWPDAHDIHGPQAKRGFLDRQVSGEPRHSSSSGCFLVVVGWFVVSPSRRLAALVREPEVDPWSHHGKACEGLPALGPSRVSTSFSGFPAPPPCIHGRAQCGLAPTQCSHPPPSLVAYAHAPSKQGVPTPPRPRPNLHSLPSDFPLANEPWLQPRAGQHTHTHHHWRADWAGPNFADWRARLHGRRAS